MAPQNDQELTVDRRAFLGVAGASLASTGLEPAPSAVAEAKSARSERRFNGPIRRIAIDPARIGEGWKLAIDEVADCTSGMPQSIASDTSSSALWTLVADKAPAANAMVLQLQQRLIQDGLRASSELDYHKTGDHAGTYSVRVAVFDSAEQCARFLKGTIADPAVSGYTALENLGDEGYESTGGWSVPGKIRFRRANVFVSVAPMVREPNTPFVAQEFDSLITTLLTQEKTAGRSNEFDAPV